MGKLAEKPSVQLVIDRIVKRIVKRFRPEKIILFGSQAPATRAQIATSTCSSSCRWKRRSSRSVYKFRWPCLNSPFRSMDTVCFHAQQCVEKYLKAVLVLHATPFPKTHDLSVLVALLPTKFRPQLDRKDQKLLTDYATVRRYPDPGGGPEISVTEARKAVALARSRSSRAAKAGLRMRFWPSVHPGENSTSLNRADAHRGARLAQYRGHRIGSALPIVRPASGHPSSQLCPISFARRITEGVQQTSYRCGASN